jgi:hypothetical protein
MTEEFEDMLPLTDQQREFLGRKYSVQCGCKSCPLGHFEACSLAMGLPYKSECDEIRAEALRLDDEYRMESQMGKEILSQEEFETMITWKPIYPDRERKMKKSHAELHARVDELENELAEREERIEIFVERERQLNNVWEKGENDYLSRIAELENTNSITCKDFSELEERFENSKKQIDDLEKQLKDEKETSSCMMDQLESDRLKIAELEKQDFEIFELKNSLYFSKKEIEQLQKQLADKKPKRMDTREEAEKRAVRRRRDRHDNGENVVLHENLSKQFEVYNQNTEEQMVDVFPYAVPREPQPGDLIINDNGHPCIVDRVINGRIIDNHHWSYDKEDCKQTGYRWDTETESIVPIED